MNTTYISVDWIAIKRWVSLFQLLSNFLSNDPEIPAVEVRKINLYARKHDEYYGYACETTPKARTELDCDVFREWSKFVVITCANMRESMESFRCCRSSDYMWTVAAMLEEDTEHVEAEILKMAQ